MVKTETPCLQYLVEAPRRAVLAAWRQVPQLHVQQIHQLHHGSHRVGYVPRLKVGLGLLGQLPGDDGRRLSSLYLTRRTKPEEEVKSLTSIFN